jgi:hypothetical protein
MTDCTTRARASRAISSRRQRITGVGMNTSIRSVLHRIATLVVVTLAVAAVFDWSGLSG